MIENAVVYDLECLPNSFLCTAEFLFNDTVATWEISSRRDDTAGLIQFCNWCHREQIPMIGFNNLAYDLLMLQHFYCNSHLGYVGLYQKNQAIFADQSTNRFGHQIWERDRFAPQIDLLKLNHFDNNAKRTSLKALEINMRSDNVMDSPVPFGQPITSEDTDRYLIPYNRYDVAQTKKFAHHCMKAIRFRIGLISQFGIDVLNYNDSKIGSKILEARLGDDLIYDRSSGKRKVRQTPRNRIALADVIFSYISFTNPEFRRVYDYMRSQILTPEDIEDPDATIKTKGVFKDLVANVGGINFGFGTGGIHGSIEKQRIIATDEWLIRDIDVEGLYPSIAIVNQLAPEHLGTAFTTEYAKLPAERKLYSKGTVENASYKLASNGTYGNSNNKYSSFYDPKFTMTITINGQLMLCMLVEWLLVVPTIKLIAVNTDGITYYIHRNYLAQAQEIEQRWQEFTRLKLEDTFYSRMWIRDVNSYIAEYANGKLKLKGAYWAPTAGEEYAASISESSPPAWHKDLGNCASIRAAVAAMVHGIDPESYLRVHSDPYDFMCRYRATGDAQLFLGGDPVQRTMRYYVAHQGEPLTKISTPPKGHVVGEWKRAPKVSKLDYDRVMRETGGAWDARVCTKAMTRYENTTSQIEAGWNVADCNRANKFDFTNVNYAYYLAEAQKLIII